MLPKMQLPNPTDFIFKDCVIAGDDCWLITPNHIDAKWDEANLEFRSAIVRKSDSKRISCGFKKFMNFGQSPHLYPNPKEFQDWHISTKLDGSLIIVSKHKGEMIIRTRGAVSIDVHDTAPEIYELINRYKICALASEDYSLVFEHTTPNNQIVLKYLEPELTLLEIIRHEDYSYMPPDSVDLVAQSKSIPRPKLHSFNSIEQIIKTCETLVDDEGFVLSYADNQQRIKLKTLSYLKLHRFKEHATLKNTFELFLTYDMPTLEAFKARLIQEFDHECYQMVEQYAEQICATKRWADEEGARVAARVEQLRGLSQKEAALTIIAEFTPQNLQSVAFALLKKNVLDKKDYSRMMERKLNP